MKKAAREEAFAALPLICPCPVRRVYIRMKSGIRAVKSIGARRRKVNKAMPAQGDILEDKNHPPVISRRMIDII